jgi:hypothetical protein
LTLIGGFFILIGGVALAIIGAIFFSLVPGVAGVFFIGLVVGLFTLVLGGLMLAAPRLHVVWGVLAIVMALLSIPFALFGFGIGFLLVLIGGILAIVFKPGAGPMMVTTTAQTMPPPPP